MDQESLPSQDPPPETEKDKAQNLEQLRQTYQELVDGSGLNDQEKKACKDWLATGESRDPKQLTMRIDHFTKAEQASAKLVDAYAKKIEESVRADLLSGKSKQSYLDWFKGLSFPDKQKYLAKSDLDKPERHAALEAYKRLPSAIREELREKFFGGGLKERQKLMAEATKRHKELKATFLKLPREIQQKYAAQFKESRFDEREKLLAKVGVETKNANNSKNKKNAQAQQEQAEVKRMEAAFESKMRRGVEANLFSVSSMRSYREWFVGLSLPEKRKALKHSDLDNPERRKTLKAFLKFSPEARAPHELKFRNVDLDRRKEILAELQAKNPQQSKNTGLKAWFRNTLRRILLSSGSREITQRMETFAVTNEIAERRKRFKLSHHTHGSEGHQKTAEEKGLTDTAEASRKLEAATQLESMREPDGGVKIKLDVLESHHEARRKWKRFLKPGMDNPNVKLAADVKLRTRSGAEVTDERQYQHEELQRELDAVKKAIEPIMAEEARSHGFSISQKQTKEELDQANWKKYGGDVIKKAA